MIIDIIGMDIEPCYAAARPRGIRRILLSNIRAKTVLRWQPRVPLPEGLKKVARWMKNQNTVN
jgi:nucleoside-diphosphate-sugar epimerase